MKKLVLVAIVAFGVFSVASLNAENLSQEQFNQLWVDCLENKNVRSCQRLANSGNLISVEQCDKELCGGIGNVYAIAKNYQQAFKYYQKACVSNDKWGCYGLAALYNEGLGVKQNFAEAFKFFKKACDLNDMGACHGVGVYYAEGKGVKQDFANARTYYEKACNENHAGACNNLGLLYVNEQGVKQNPSTAKKYFGKACDLGDQAGCDNYKILNKQGIQRQSAWKLNFLKDKQ